MLLALGSESVRRSPFGYGSVFVVHRHETLCELRRVLICSASPHVTLDVEEVPDVVIVCTEGATVSWPVGNLVFKEATVLIL